MYYVTYSLWQWRVTLHESPTLSEDNVYYELLTHLNQSDDFAIHSKAVWFKMLPVNNMALSLILGFMSPRSLAIDTLANVPL